MSLHRRQAPPPTAATVMKAIEIYSSRNSSNRVLNWHCSSFSSAAGTATAAAANEEAAVTAA